MGEIYSSLSAQERKDSPFSRPPTTGPRNRLGYAQCINPKCKQWNVLPGFFGRCNDCIHEAAQRAAVIRHRKDMAIEAMDDKPKHARIKGVQEDWRQDVLSDLRERQ